MHYERIASVSSFMDQKKKNSFRHRLSGYESDENIYLTKINGTSYTTRHEIKGKI